MADLLKMVENSRAISASDVDHRVKKQIDILSAMGHTTTVTPGLHPSELQLIDGDEDPFGGNTNNRRVAERVAKQRKKVWTSSSGATHSGDPDKARADLEKSYAVNPEPDSQDGQNYVITDPDVVPSPGSPAALRAAAATVPRASVSGGSGGSSEASGSAIPSASAPAAWKPGK